MASAWERDAIAFRPLTQADLPLLHRWLNEPHVRRWWDDEPTTLAGLVAKHAPRLAGRDPVREFVIVYAGRPVGFIQIYRVADDPEWAQICALAEPAAGLDLYLGEPDVLHRGLGQVVIRRFLREVVFAGYPEVTCCVLDPHPDNRAAIRAYEKCGFRFLKMIAPPGGPPGYLMRVGRAEVPPD